MTAKTIIDSPWVNRALMVIIVAGIAFVGNFVWDINQKLTEPQHGVIAEIVRISTVQDKVLVPSLRELKSELNVLTDNLLNQPRFDKEDSRRMDDRHLGIMNELDNRIRELEKGGNPDEE